MIAAASGDRFLRYVVERQKAADRRAAGEPPPWSEDPVIREIRDDDRTSKEARQIILALPERLRLPTALSFRLYNKVGTLVALRDADVLGSEESAKILRVFERLKLEADVFCRAYKISVGPSGFFSKEDTARVLARAARAVRLGDFTLRRFGRHTAAAVRGALGINAPFSVGQIAQDLRWIGGPYEDEEEWATIGPGAVRGLARLCGEFGAETASSSPTKLKELAAKGFKTTKDTEPVPPRMLSEMTALLTAMRNCTALSCRDRITLAEVQHNLCEADKFARITANPWRGRRFVPLGTQPATRSKIGRHTARDTCIRAAATTFEPDQAAIATAAGAAAPPADSHAATTAPEDATDVESATAPTAASKATNGSMANTEIPTASVGYAIQDDSAGAAIDFLRAFLGENAPWPLVAIKKVDKKNDIKAATSSAVPKREAGVARWVRRWNDEGYNIYFAINPLRSRLNKKADKDDVAAAAWLWIDLDPRKDADPSAEQAALDRALTADRPAGIPVPTWEIDSGRGRWGFWRLSEPILVDGGNGTATRRVEGHGRGIEQAFGKDFADNCRNIDRIARLPGAVNHKTGRRARVVAHRAEVVYDLQDFPFLDAQPANGHDIGAAEAPIDLDKLPNVNVDALPVSDRIKHMIHTGEDTEDSKPFRERRSERAFTVLIAMAAAECDDATMAAVMLDPALPIGEHIRDQSNITRALTRIIERARQRVQSSELFKMNEQNAVLPVGGKTRVATWGDDPDFPGRHTITRFSSFSDFKALQDKYRLTYEGKDKKGNTSQITVGLGSWWISHTGRRQYDGGMRFMPTRNEDVVGNTLNLWQGFAVPARKPDGKSGAAGCKLFLDHGLKIICSGDEQHFDYLIKREAFIAQRRTRTEVAVCLKTEDEGAGKGLWERWLNHLYGQHAMQVHKPEHVTGKHNKHLEVLLRLTADEALFAGDPRHRNALYGLTTEATVTIEPKFVDAYSVGNYINIDTTSNAEHFAPVSATARRFFVPTVSPDRVGDLEYFNKLAAQMTGEGGAEALLYHLLYEVDIRDYNPRDVPKTKGLAEQQRHSLAPLDSWWIELLEGGTLEGSDPARPERAVSNEYQREIQQTYADGNTYSKYVRQRGLFDQARTVEPRLKYHTSDHLLGGYLRAKGCISGKVLQRRGWKFPPLDQCRKEWVARFPGWTWRDPDIETWCAEEEPDVPAGTTPPAPPDYPDEELI